MERDLNRELSSDPDPDVAEAWAAEEERWWQEIENGAAVTIPWDEVRARLFSA